MADQPLSVITVTYNSRREVDDCLSSLFADLGERPVQVLVVDNASPDGTAAYVAARWPQVTLLAQDNNLGFAAANNVGLAAANGDLILLLNPDTVVQPGALAALLKVLDHHPEVGVVGPMLLNADGTLQPSCRDFPSLLHDLIGMSEIHRLDVVRRLLTSHVASLSDHSNACQVDWLNGACLLIRRAAIDAVGPLDAGFFMYSEEMEWQYRMRQQGWGIWFEPLARVTHLGGASTAAVPGERVVWQYRSIFRFYRLYRGWARQQILRLIVWTITCPKITFLILYSHSNPRRRKLLHAFWKVLWMR